MTPFLLRSSVRLLLLGILFAPLYRTCLAVQAAQSLQLAYGWSPVWLELGPMNTEGQAKTCSQVFVSQSLDVFQFDRVVCPVGEIGTAEFTSAKESLFNQGDWDDWELNKESGECANVAVHGNHAYLVHVSTLDGSNQYGVTARDLPLRGEVWFYRLGWTKGEYNLVGFGFERASTFASLMAGSGIKVDGPLGAKPHFPARLPSPFLILRASCCLSAGTLRTAKSSTLSASFATSMTSDSTPPSPPIRGVV